MTNSAIRFVMTVACSSGHTREKLWSVLCALQFLLESFVHLLYSSRCFACKWLIKLDVPPPSASCWVQRRHCTRFTSLPLTFAQLVAQRTPKWDLYAFCMPWLSACTHIAVFHTCLVPSTALFPDQIRKWVWE